MSILQILPAEIIANVLSYIVSIPDLLNVRLTSKSFAAHVVPLLQSVAFKHIKLPLDDSKQLEAALFHVNDSIFAANIQRITINGIHNCALSLCGKHTIFTDGQLLSENYPILQYKFDLIESILSSFTDLDTTLDEIAACSGTPKLLQYLMRTTVPDATFLTCDRPKRQQWYSALAYTSEEVLTTINSSSLLILRLCSGLQFPVTTLKLDDTILSLADIEYLAETIRSVHIIKRLTFHLHEHLDVPKTEHMVIHRSAVSLASALQKQLEELVLSSTGRRHSNGGHSVFLASFLECAHLEKLNYLCLEGFSVHSTILLQFLKRHRNTIEQHIYDDFVFDGMEQLDNDEFESMLNQELSAEDLSHLLISSATLDVTEI